MKKIIYTTISFIVFLSSCSMNIYQVSYQTIPVNIDCNSKKWPIPLTYNDSKMNLQYSVTNDKVNLYICVRVIDEQTQMKVLLGGMEIWLDTIGKNKRSTVLSYPLADNKTNKVLQLQPQQELNLNLLKENIDVDKKHMILSGFKNIKDGKFLTQNNSGICVCVKTDSLNVLFYQAIIPFKTFYKQQLNTNDTNKILGLTFSIKAITPQSPEGEGPDRADVGGGQFVPGEGGPPPDMRREFLQSRNSIFVTNIIKIKIKLAFKL